MNQPSPLTSQEIDDGWCLEEAPPTPPEYESYEIVDERVPASGFEEAYMEQVEGRTLKRRFGEGTRDFGVKRAN